jgi:glyoxylase-like metal-dependent hydrolase (beta-lactamase superfamily II)
VLAHEEAGTVADRTFSSVGVVDLGDRAVELVHAGRAHSPGDALVHVPDAGVLVVGDVASWAGPRYAEDSFPLDWPAALDLAVGLVTEGSVVVPGHGALMDQAALQQLRADTGAVAEALFDLAARSVPETQAVAGLEWPTSWTPERREAAVRRGYAHVPRTARRLPLV